VEDHIMWDIHGVAHVENSPLVKKESNGGREASD
jgi:hypothetical protein